jgi:hypothetical protein
MNDIQLIKHAINNLDLPLRAYKFNFNLKQLARGPLNTNLKEILILNVPLEATIKQGSVGAFLYANYYSDITPDAYQALQYNKTANTNSIYIKVGNRLFLHNIYYTTEAYLYLFNKEKLIKDDILFLYNRGVNLIYIYYQFGDSIMYKLVRKIDLVFLIAEYENESENKSKSKSENNKFDFESKSDVDTEIIKGYNWFYVIIIFLIIAFIFIFLSY